MLKILGGEYRSRILVSPPERSRGEPMPGLRPYVGRVKESVFNLLRGWFEDAHVLDLFAGVGTVGLECVSRGAARVLLVERDKRVYAALKENIETLGCGDRAEPLFGDALSELTLLRAPAPLDLVFVDPPYAMMTEATDRDRVLAQCTRVAEYMKPQSFLILRSPRRSDENDPETIDGFIGPEVHDYGKGMRVLLYQPTSADSSD